MQILLDNNKISNYSIVDKGMNTLGYENLNEVFFDVYEIKSNGLDLVKEKKGEFDGNPIIEVDLKIEDQIYKNVRFVLTKENKININPNFLDHTKVFVREKIQKKKILETVQPIKKVELVVKKEEKNPKRENPIIIEKNIIEKTKIEFLETIKEEVLTELKNEVKVGIIKDLIKENLQINFDSVVQDNGNKNKLQKILENFNNSFRKEFIELAEKVSRREAMRYVESGGGTNAIQYANGGVMNGDLSINGNLIVNNQPYIKKVVFEIGDGLQQSFVFNHNLNTKNILVNVQDSITNEIVIPYIQLIDENSLLIEFSFVPDSNSYRLIIFG